MAPDPGIHQHIARPGIETAHRRPRQQHRKIGDTANVQHHATFHRMRQQRLMEGRHQWRALAPIGHITPPKIPHGGDIGQRGNAIVIAQLHREACVTFGLVPYRLAMATDSGDVLGRNAGLFQQAKHRLAEQCAELRIESPHCSKRGLLPLAHTENILLELNRHRMAVAGLLRHHSSVYRGKHHVDAIQTGAGHNTYIAA
ncbi:hypothetical protein D3C71_1228310 [compost metagenome]